MMTLLQCEYQKTRKRYLLLIALTITAVQLVWVLHGDHSTPFILKNGWMMFLYQLPLFNAIFLPLLSLVVSSSLCDLEHKGAAFKQLAVLIKKEKLYDAKLIYGLAIVFTCTLISWCSVILFGYIKGFEGNVPLKWYLLYLLFTIVPTVAVYLFQYALAMLFKNQAVSFFTGIIGTFLGLFSMFLPQFPMLRRLFLWGYYGVLQFVGLFGWTSETRYEDAYFSIMKIDWAALIFLIAISLFLYAAGRFLFSGKEI